MFDAAKLAIAPYLIWIKVGLCVLALAGAYWWGYSTKAVACEAAQLAHEAQDTKDRLAQSEAAREQEKRHAADMARAAQEHEDAKREVQNRADAAYRAVLADNGRLRDHWQGCRATSATIAGSAEPDGQDRLRAESLRRVLEWVGLLQAQRDGLQAVVKADRE